MTPDPSDLGGLVATLVVTVVASLLIAAAVYVWTGLAMSRLFGRLSVEPWRGWVPLLNLAEILALGGSPRWIALLFLVPFANIYALVMFAIAAHRVNVLFGRGAGMTVLAVLVLPAWASVLAWGRDAPDPERGRLATAVGRTAQPTGPLAVPPEPVAPRHEPAGADAGASSARAFPPLPGLEHQAPVRPGAQPAAERPAAFAPVPPPPATIAPPPGLGEQAGWPVSPPARQAQTPAPAPSGSAGWPASGQPVSGQPVSGQPVSGQPASPQQAQAGADASGRPGPAGWPASSQPAFPQHPPTGQAVPRPESVPAQTPPGPAWAPGPDLATPSTAEAAAAPAAPGGQSATSSPANAEAAAAPAAPWAAGPDLAPPSANVQGTAAGTAAVPAAGHPAAFAAPVPPTGQPAPAGPRPAGAAGAPSAAPPAPADDQHGGLDFAEAATILVHGDEANDVEATVIVDRRPRREWRLELDDGEVLSLTGEVIVLGRNPSAGAGEQRLAVPDRTRTLSKTHARLAHRNGVWTITDLRSTNGVLIVDTTGEETLIEPDVETSVSGRFVLGEVGMRVIEGGA
ncbi:DUF5684 domain-containing protein [Agromyces aerolatus]|uniref:DUF5684 domain-containing protein n=1 Tax=Agromyces sp. LY-1074 TaxID=3074080 RepID=UPI00285D6ED6|nr:DUF5684 domain-containing protein [Agromyces sp. LY-1358]MDR5706934.1 DUF5684 domain-containing protein [Agromyces sp. LY-1358]